MTGDAAMACAGLQMFLGAACGLERFDGGYGYSTERYNKGLPGACYYAALAVMVDIVGLGEDKDVRVCHGVLTCNAVELHGERILHAWVEVKVNEFTLVIDASYPFGPLAVTTSEAYYKACGVNAENVRRYTREECASLADMTDHYGPWQQPLEASQCWTDEMTAKLIDGVYFDE